MFSFNIIFCQTSNYYFDYTGTAQASTIQGNEQYVFTKTSTEGVWTKLEVKLALPYSFSNEHNNQTVSSSTFSCSESTNPSPSSLTSPNYYDSYNNAYFSFETTGNNNLSAVTVTRSYYGTTNVNMPAICLNDLFPVDRNDLATNQRQYLDASSNIQSDNTSIESQAQSITSGCFTIVNALEAIQKWVYDNIQYQSYNKKGDSNSGRIDQDALSVFNQRTLQDANGNAITGRFGNCEGFSNITIALLRSIGIPARYVSGVIIPKTFSMPFPSGFTTPSLTTGGAGPGYHATHEVFYPSLNDWISGDGQGTVNFVKPNFVRFGHTQDRSSLAAGFKVHWDGAHPLPTITRAEPINTSISAITANFASSNNYVPFGTAGNGNVLLGFYDFCSPVGLFDAISITNPPSGTDNCKFSELPDNSNVFNIGNNINFSANFASYQCATSVTNLKWSIELYHSNGVYSYIYPTSSGSSHCYGTFCSGGYFWEHSTHSNLPEYNWIYDLNGNIYGNIKVTATLSDNDILEDTKPVSVNCDISWQNVAVNTNQTFGGCNAEIENVTIQDNCDVIFNINDETVIYGPFEVEVGSTFTIN